MDVNVFGQALLLIPVQPPSVCLNPFYPQTVSTIWRPLFLLKEVETISSGGSGPVLPLPLPIEAITFAAVVAKLLSERVKTTGRQSIAGNQGWPTSRRSHNSAGVRQHAKLHFPESSDSAQYLSSHAGWTEAALHRSAKNDKSLHKAIEILGFTRQRPTYTSPAHQRGGICDSS